MIETYRELCVSIQELSSERPFFPIRSHFLKMPRSDMDQDHEMNRVLYVLTMVPGFVCRLLQKLKLRVVGDHNLRPLLILGGRLRHELQMCASMRSVQTQPRR